MKTVKLFALAVMGLAAIAACSRDTDNSAVGGMEISIRASIGEISKVATTGNKAEFENGDQVALYAWTGSATAVSSLLVVNGVKNTLGTDGKWTPETQMLWADMVTPHYFIGIHPARTVTSFTADKFTLDPADYKASDLLIAKNVAGLVAQKAPVALTFNHAMALLKVNLAFRDQWSTPPTVTAISATARKEGNVDYLKDNAVTASGMATEVALAKIENASWSGLQVPQSGVRVITIKIEGKDYVFTNTEDIPLAGGRITTVNLNVGRDKIDLASPLTISDWVTGETIENGEAQTED